MREGAGPPTPLAGPANPGCAWPRGTVGTPRPAARPTPGPPAAAAADLARESSCVGGPSTVKLTISSPRRMIKPRVRRSSLSSGVLTPFFGGSLRNSSESPSTRFI